MSVGSIFSSNYFFPAPVLPIIQNKEEFITVLKGKDFHRLETELKSFFSKLSTQEQDEYLKEIAFVGFKTNDPQFLDRCLKLLDFEAIVALLKKTRTNFVDFETSLKQRCDHFKYRPKRTFDSEHTFFLDISQDISYLFNVLVSYINTLIQSFNLLDVNRQPKSAWDASFQLQIYYQLFEIPLKLFSGLQTYITNPLLLKVSLLGLLIALYSYIKWLQPPPSELPKGINLSQLIQQPVRGRLGELLALIQKLSFVTKTDEIRKHLYICAETGVGKNALINGLAYELRHNETGLVPAHLRKKQLVIFKASEFIKNDSFDGSSFLQTLENAIGKHGTSFLPVVDQAELLFSNDKAKTDMKIMMNNSPLNRIPNWMFVSTTKVDVYGDPELESRLVPFVLEVVKEEQSLEILESSPTLSTWDLEFSREDLRPFILSDSKDHQPTPALQNLINALLQIQNNWEGQTLLTDLNGLKKELAALASKTPFHADGDTLNEKTDLYNQIRAIQKKIEAKTLEIRLFQKTVQTFKDMKKRGNAIEDSLSSLINRLQRPNWRDQRYFAALKIQFLFTEFYLLKMKDKAIKEFAKEHKIMTSLKETIPPKSSNIPLEFTQPIYVLDMS